MLTVSLKRTLPRCDEWRACVTVADRQRQEVSLGGGASRQCFHDLTPSSQYEISVHTRIRELEGPAVSVTDMTSIHRHLPIFFLPLRFFPYSRNIIILKKNYAKHTTSTTTLMSTIYVSVSGKLLCLTILTILNPCKRSSVVKPSAV